MTRLAWLADYRSLFETSGVGFPTPDQTSLPPAIVIDLKREDWRTAAQVSSALCHRFVAVWGDAVDGGFVVRACYASAGNYLVVQTGLPSSQPTLSSVASLYPGASRMERHLHDLLGLVLTGTTDDRPWTRHRAWAADEYPLRPDFPVAGRPLRRTPSDADYPFKVIKGSGVYEIPVGPVHAGIIEPGHFRFQAVGEDVLLLEERLGYVHKGIEKIARGRDPDALARLAARVSGDSTVAHTWAACQAMERASGCSVPARAEYLRAVLCERERIANHLGDIGAICNDVAFVFAHMQCARLREVWQRTNREIFGHRLLMDTICPGGVASDIRSDQITQLRKDNKKLASEIVPLFDIVDDHPSLDDRLVGTGVLKADDAAALGCTGYVGKASSRAFDVRIDAPYKPYDAVDLAATVFSEGDVAARVRVRMHEIQSSLSVLDQLLDRLPDGDTITRLPIPAQSATGLGLVDGWRGEVMTFVRFDGEGRIARYFPRDPSWFTWPALERLIGGNIVPDFPVCNKSVNASYSGHDL